MYEFLSRLVRSLANLLPSPESDSASAPAAARCSSPVAAAEEDAGTYVRLAEGTGPVYDGRTVAGVLEADAVKSFWCASMRAWIRASVSAQALAWSTTYVSRRQS